MSLLWLGPCYSFVPVLFLVIYISSPFRSPFPACVVSSSSLIVCLCPDHFHLCSDRLRVFPGFRLQPIVPLTSSLPDPCLICLPLLNDHMCTNLLASAFSLSDVFASADWLLLYWTCFQIKTVSLPNSVLCRAIESKFGCGFPGRDSPYTGSMS